MVTNKHSRTPANNKEPLHSVKQTTTNKTIKNQALETKNKNKSRRNS